MTTMNISLSEKMKAYVQSKVESGDYHNASEYIRDLIRQEERKSWAMGRLQEELQKGLDSGPAIKVDDLQAFFDESEKRAIEELKAEGVEIKP
jgi:antitoxin ParD1/3/4